VARFFLISCFMLCIFPSSAATDRCAANSGKSETFSSVTKVPAPASTIQPDALLAGIELLLEEHSNHVAATLRDYEGALTPLTAKLEGTIQETATGCKVHLSGRNSRGKVEIDGTIGTVSLDGTIVRTIGKQLYSETISLKRKPSETDNHVGALFEGHPAAPSQIDPLPSRSQLSSVVLSFSTKRMLRNPAREADFSAHSHGQHFLFQGNAPLECSLAT
jgi:hypothetical protein